MIELTAQQIEALEDPSALPAQVLNPQTQEKFVLLREADYARLKEGEYDDTPWTREELEALAWKAGKEIGWEEMDEYDALPEQP